MVSINPNHYFSPGRALGGASDLFVGREPQFADALRLLARNGTSIAIFGQRGIGKTSFGWQLKGILQAGSIKKGPHPDSEILKPLALAASETLWIQCRKGMRDVTGVLLALLQPAVGKDKTLQSVKRDSLLTPTEVTEIKRVVELNLGVGKFGSQVTKSAKDRPSSTEEQRAIELSSNESQAWDLFYQTIKKLADRIEREVIVFVDEFDGLPQRLGMGHLIKECKDARFVVVGIAESSQEILEDSPSGQRWVRDLPILPFSEEEVDAVFANAEAISARKSPQCTLHFDSEYKDLVFEGTGGHPDLVHEYGYETLEYARDKSSGSKLVLNKALFDEVDNRIYNQDSNQPHIQRIREAVRDVARRERILHALCKFPHGWVEELELADALSKGARKQFGPNLDALKAAGIIEKDASGDRVRFTFPRDRQVILNLIRNNVTLT
jgi:hypothetical protein